MNRLRGLLTFHTDESIASYCSRIAGALGHRHAQYFCSKQHFNFHGLAVGRPGDVSAFAQLLGMEDVELSSGLIVTKGHWHRLRGETLNRTLVIRSALRICPHCILDDETHPFGRAGFRAFGRLLWLVEPVRVCEKHGTKLVTTPPTSLPIWTHDFWAKLSASRAEFRRFVLQSKSMRRDDLDSYVTARLSGTFAPSWLNDLPLYVAVHLVETVGATVRHGARFLVSRMTEDERSACAHDGFQLLADGKQALASLLERLIRDSSARKTGDIGGRAIFGRLYEMLAHENDDAAYDLIRGMMREVGLSNLALGPGDHFFGPIESRRVHSVHSAAKEFDIHPIRLKKMIVKAGLVEAEMANLPSDRILVDAETMAAFVERSKALVSASDTRERLGASRTELLALVTAGYLRKNGGRMEGNGDDLTLMPKYAIQEIDNILARLVEAVPSTAPKANWVDLSTARKRAECSLEEIFALIFAGSAEGVARTPGFVGFSAVRLDAAELKKKTVLTEHGCLSIQQVEHALPARSAVVKALIKNGHLIATQRRNPIKRHLQTVIEPSELEKFKAKFASLHEIARARGTNPAKALKLLAGIPPAFDPVEIGGGRYYKRSDLVS